MFDLVRLPEDRFSRDVAYVMSVSSKYDWNSLEVKTIIENIHKQKHKCMWPKRAILLVCIKTYNQEPPDPRRRGLD